MFYILYLLAKHLDTILKRLGGLLHRTANGRTKDQLSFKLPVLGKVINLLHLLGKRRQEVIVLQTGAEALCFKCRPDCSDGLVRLLKTYRILRRERTGQLVHSG